MYQLKRGKLNEKAQVGVLAGYIAKSKGYRVLCTDDMKILVNRDVHIDEELEFKKYYATLLINSYCG